MFHGSDMQTYFIYETFMQAVVKFIMIEWLTICLNLFYRAYYRKRYSYYIFVPLPDRKWEHLVLQMCALF